MWSTPSIVAAEFGLGYGTNQVCPAATVESQPLLVDDRANVLRQAELRMGTDGWQTRMSSRGRRLELVAQRDDRVVIGFFMTQVSSEDRVILRSYPRACVDPDFVPIGFEPS